MSAPAFGVRLKAAWGPIPRDQSGELRVRQGDEHTAIVPALGGFTTPAVIAFQMSPTGSSSFQGTVNSGESHRTMDDGSSNR